MWVAVRRNEREFIDLVVGDRSSQTEIKLWQNIENESIEKVFSDFWKSYKEIIPCEKLYQSKAETFTVEGFNSLIRHYSARFRRETKCYTKSLEMMILSLKLVMPKRNNVLSMQIY